MGYLLLIGIIVLLLAERIFYQLRRKKEINQLIQYLTDVQNQLELPKLQEFREGNLAVLQSEIYKVVARLREQSSNERKEKTYLADMLSDISHQVKTPLSAITIMVDLLQSEELPEEKRFEYVGKIQIQVNKITWLIRNLLTISQLEANVLTLKKEKVLMQELAERVMNSLEILAEVREVELTCDTPGEELTIVCDEAWTIEAITNIVKNCVEHTRAGGRVCISYGQNNLTTFLEIRDTGCGISKEELPYIFERFYKGSNPSETSVGIGLFMAKQILLKQSADISVESTVGVGTQFVVKFYRT